MKQALAKLCSLAIEAATWIETGSKDAASLCADLRRYAAILAVPGGGVEHAKERYYKAIAEVPLANEAYEFMEQHAESIRKAGWVSAIDLIERMCIALTRFEPPAQAETAEPSDNACVGPSEFDEFERWMKKDRDKRYQMWPAWHARAQLDATPSEAMRRDAERWQPIETAPKGVSVLLYCSRNIPIYAGKQRHGELGEPEQDKFAWRCDSSGRYAHPSHWMPLPSPPST